MKLTITNPQGGGGSGGGVQVVTQSATLLSSSDYRVMVGTRSASATITLPDPGGFGQTIEVLDSSLQADTFPITINAGTKTIFGSGSSLILSSQGSNTRLTYNGTSWM
jgi:hypothetical protein